MEKVATIAPAMSSTSPKNIASVINQFGKRLLGFIRKRVKTDEDAEDVLQDVWYQLTAAVDTEPIEQVSSWLFTVARNKITDRYRKKKPLLIDDMLPADSEDADIGLGDILLDDSNSPESVMLRNLFWKDLDEALASLPPEQRDVFVWNELEDIPFKTISERTGVAVNTLISRKRYAVLHLRERLLSLYNEIVGI